MQKGFYLFETDLGHYSQTQVGKISSLGDEKTGGYISKGDLGHYGDQRDISTRSYPKRKFTKSSDTRDLDYFRLVFVLLYLPMFQNQSYSLVGYM